MPIYEYECTECGHKLDKFQKVDDPPLIRCPACHNDTLKKMVSAAAFQLKGSGWYETDFKDKKPKEKPDDSKKTESSTKKEKKSDNASSE